MLLHLAEQLDVPLRERNVLLAAAGYAAVFRERSLKDPALAAARTAIDLVLAGHEPSRQSPSIATGGWCRPTRRPSCCWQEWIRICCGNQSMRCAWRYTPMYWRRAPSISPSGGRTYWRGFCSIDVNLTMRALDFPHRTAPHLIHYASKFRQ